MNKIKTVINIKTNQIGFTPTQKKEFYIKNPKQNTYLIEMVKDATHIVVYESELVFLEREDDCGYVGDFTCFEQIGDFRIKCGKDYSRYFSIYDKVYEYPIRLMLNYFTMQRCGSELGWSGKCHQDDGIIFQTKEKVDLRGGYHQSCDLRKSPAGTSIGIYQMLNSAEKDNSEWGKILFTNEIEWACEYLNKTISENGFMYNTLNAPHGWNGRIFYNSPAPASAQWCATASLALGARLLKKMFAEKSAVWLATAEKSWNYMTKYRNFEKYKHPDVNPLGMDQEYFYQAIYKDSVADIAYSIMAATELFKLTNKEEYLTKIYSDINKISKNFKDGFLLSDFESITPLISECSYSWSGGGMMAFCKAYEVINDEKYKKIIIDILKNIAENIKGFVKKTIWGLYPIIFTRSQLNEKSGFPDKNGHYKTLKERISQKIYSFSEDYSYIYKNFVGGYSIPIALCAKSISKILKDDELKYIADKIVNNMFGFNKMDMCYVECIGYNHSMPIPYGQFFPSTPRIAGGIGIGVDDNIHTQTSSEYDMPIVGGAMWLLSSYKY